MNSYLDTKHWVWHNNDYPTLHQFQKMFLLPSLKMVGLNINRRGTAQVKYSLSFNISMNMIPHLYGGGRETGGIVHQSIGASNIYVGDVTAKCK